MIHINVYFTEFEANTWFWDTMRLKILPFRWG